MEEKMRFTDLVAEALDHKESGVRSNQLGTILDLFGNASTEQMTPLYIEENLQSVSECRSRSLLGVYRSNLRRLFDYAVKVGAAKSNPVLFEPRPGPHGRNYRKRLHQLKAVELLKRFNELR